MHGRFFTIFMTPNHRILHPNGESKGQTRGHKNEFANFAILEIGYDGSLTLPEILRSLLSKCSVELSYSDF